MSRVEWGPPGAELAAAVEDGEYHRLLGWPPDRPLEGALAAHAAEARAWYAESGRPWAATRRIEVRGVDATRVHLATGASFHGAAFVRRLADVESHAVVAAALTAGPEIEREARRRWADGKPDEGFFLDRFGAAVVEALVRWLSRQLCRAAEPAGETVMFHLSPGCGSWPLSEQRLLHGRLAESGAGRAAPGLRADSAGERTGPVRLLESGGLEPGPSLLAVLALSRRSGRATAADACRTCDLGGCAFRRAPFRRMR